MTSSRKESQAFYPVNPEDRHMLLASGLVGACGLPQLGRAIAYLQGDYHLGKKSAPKTWRFDHNLEFPELSEYATCDSHIFRLTAGIYDRGGTYAVCISVYLMIERWVAELAQEHGMPVAAMQALLWIVGKDILDGKIQHDLPTSDWFSAWVDAKYTANGKTPNGYTLEMDIAKQFMSKHNLQLVLDYATDQHMQTALAWYPDSHDYIDRVSRRHGIQTKHIRRVTAIISPMRDWYYTDGGYKNIDDAVKLIKLVNQYRIRVEYKYRDFPRDEGIV